MGGRRTIIIVVIFPPPDCFRYIYTVAMQCFFSLVCCVTVGKRSPVYRSQHNFSTRIRASLGSWGWMGVEMRDSVLPQYFLMLGIYVKTYYLSALLLPQNK